MSTGGAPERPDLPGAEADAAALVARTQARLAAIEQEAARVSSDAWRTVWRQLRTMLQQLAASPLVTEDPHAVGLLRDLAGARDAEELALLFGPLADYLEDRAAAHARSRVEAGELDPAVLEDLTAARRRDVRGRPPASSVEAETAIAAGARPPARTVLRL